ncbi:hypothetical protein Q3G72_015187 [Acer saccharum]|nr:hypothetical protein Q3G72_015187 [Acer saccharum]
MDARNGKILWSIADPSNALAFGPVTLANGVLLAGSTHGKGPIYAMNAKREKFCGSTTLEEWRLIQCKQHKTGQTMVETCITGDMQTRRKRPATKPWPNYN